MTQECTCPSGLRGTIRGMTGLEAQNFVDPRMMRTGGSMDALLNNCWLETIDPGVYELIESKDKKRPDPRPPWSTKALMGDRFAAIIDVRIATFGETYEFNVKCENCEQKIEWELSLRDLPRKEFPDDTLAKIKAGQNNFRIELPDAKIMMFHISTADDERKIAALKGGVSSTRKLGVVDAMWVQTNGIYVQVLDGRVLGDGDTDPTAGRLAQDQEITDEVTGITLRPISGGPMGIRRYFEGLGFAECLDVLERMQEHDGGVETTIEVICEHCNWQQKVEMPFQRSFFERPKKRAAS